MTEQMSVSVERFNLILASSLYGSHLIQTDTLNVVCVLTQALKSNGKTTGCLLFTQNFYF